MSLQQLKDNASIDTYGMTAEEARHQSVCIDCNEDIEKIGFPTEMDEREYYNTALCHKCFDKIFEEN